MLLLQQERQEQQISGDQPRAVKNSQLASLFLVPAHCGWPGKGVVKWLLFLKMYRA